MEKKMSCCGTVCSDCEYYPADCRGCREIKGKVFWLEYTGESCCDIYECCINKRKYGHCSQCEELPCSRYDREDPTKTKEENEADHAMQMKNLKEHKGEERKMNRDLGIARCGLACCLCSENTNCAGCNSGDCPGKDWCENRKCSLEKGIRHCYACDEDCQK